MFIKKEPGTMEEKLIHYFSQNKCEGNAEMKNLLGGKGANLAEMCNIGVPVPPGFTISTSACKVYYQDNRSSVIQVADYSDSEENVDSSVSYFHDTLTTVIPLRVSGIYAKRYRSGMT